MDKMNTNILDSLSNHVAVINNKGLITYTNKAWDIFYENNTGGLTNERSVVGENYLNKCLKASKTSKQALEVYEGIQSVVSGKTKTFSHDFSINNNKWYTISATLLNKEEGIVLILEDNTNLVLADKNLIIEKQKFEVLFSETNVGMVILDNSFHIAQANRSFCDFIGYSAEELTKLTPIDITVPDEIKKSEGMLKNMSENKKREKKVEKKYIRKNGKEVWGEVKNKQIKLDSGKVIYHATIVDITQRIKQENELKEAKKNLANIVDYANIGIAYADEKAKLIAVNPEFIKILEYTNQEELIGKTIADFTHPDDLEKDLNLLEEIREGKRDSFHIEKRYVTKNNNIRWINLQVSTVRENNGVVINFIAMVSDITEQKEREEALLKSGERLKMATRYAKAGVWDWDVVNNILVWDDSMYELYDLKKSEFAGAYDAWEKTLHQEDMESANDEVTKALSGEKEFDTVFRIITSSGGTKYIQARGNVQFNEDNKAIRMLGVNYDVTEKEKSQFEIHNAIIKTEEAERQRISHDLHDGLGQTIAAANMFMNTMEGFAEEQLDEEAMSVFNTGKALIHKAAKETRLVSHNIMPRSLKQFGLEETVTQMLNNYEKINSNLSIKIESNLNDFRFNSDQELTIFRALQESMNNAIKHSGVNELRCVLKKDKDKLLVSVIDKGVGFDSNEVRKNKDAGIGLVSLSQRIKMIGGKLTIDSAKKKGTTIEITIKLD